MVEEKVLYTRMMSKRTWLLLGFILAKFILQYTLVNPYYDLHRDEYLHLDQGDHLAWGYLSVPPVTSWLSYIIKLLGGSVFMVKFFPALFGALTLLVVWKTIQQLNGNLYALVLGAVCTLFSVYIRLNYLYQPNSLDVLCWAILYFLLIRYINSQQQKWLLIGAIVFALGFLNKYNIVFQILGLIPAVLLTEHRQLLAKKGFYIAAVLALLLILPNLLWQYSNNFPVVHHLKELADTQLVHVSRWLFLKEQFFFFIGAMPVILASLYALLFYAPFRKYRVFFWSFVFTIAVFTIFKAKGYYAMGLYPAYIAFGSAYLGTILNTKLKSFLKPVFIAIPIVFYIVLFHVIYSVESPDAVLKNKEAYSDLGLLRWEDGKDHVLPQDIADMLGWKELAAKVDAACSKFPGSSRTLVLCDNYGQAGAINYYSSNKAIRAVSFNADYINWFDFDTRVDNLIRVKEFEDSSNELAETGPFFEVAFKSDSIADPLAREYRTTIFVFSKPKIDINARLKQEVETEKWH